MNASFTNDVHNSTTPVSPASARAKRAHGVLLIAIVVLSTGFAADVVWGILQGESDGIEPWLTAGAGAVILLIALACGLYAASQSRASEQGHLLELRNLADHDPLSGLANYRSLRATMDQVLARAAPDGTHTALTILDLNDFKDANDRFGQEAGDAIVSAIGAALRDAVGDAGIVARYGGDEFAILMPGADRAAARSIADVAADAIEHASLSALPQNEHLHITASWGIAVSPDDGADAEAMIAHADQALYRHKAERSAVVSRTDERHAQDVLFAIGNAIGRSPDPQKLVQNLVRAVAGSLGLDSCAIWLLQEHVEHVRIRAYHASEPDFVEKFAAVLTAEPFQEAEARERGLLSRAIYSDDVTSLRVLPERFAALFPPDTWCVSVPLESSRQGAMMLVARHATTPPPSMSLVEAIGRLASAAISNAGTYADAKMQGERLTALAGVGGLLFGDGAYEERLAALVERIADIIQCDTLTLDTADPRNETSFLRQFWARGRNGQPMDEGVRDAWLSIKPSLDEPTVVEFLAKAVEPIVMDDPLNQVPPIYHDVIVNGGIESVVVMPIVWQGSVKGLFYFSSYRKNAFSAQDIAVMQTIAAQLAPSLQVATLHVELEHSYAELKEAHRDAILRLAYAAEARDPYTGRHLQRIGKLSQEIARRMGFDEDAVEAIGYAAIVHDLGKLRIPDSILIKPGELSVEDWVVMKKHPEYGADLLGAGGFYNLAREVALHHHERWDGSGYPFGLVHEAIPAAARIVMVADIYDALISARPYKPAWPAARALEELTIMRGHKLCPNSVNSFLAMWEDGTVARIEAETLDASFESDFRERWAA